METKQKAFFRIIYKTVALGLIILGFGQVVLGEPIETNHVTLYSPPDWLKRTRVEGVTDRIQHRLGWSTRKVNVYYYSDEGDFLKVHSLGPQATAVTKIEGKTATVHLGPKVTNDTFDAIFGHELVHVIIFQKFGGGIPKWLEEGLANHLTNRAKVDYAWLKTQPFPTNMNEFAHPFSEGASADQIQYRYRASQAFAEMLAKKCNLERLLDLSVASQMEIYIKNYCEIKNMPDTFKQWVISRK